MKKLYRLMRHDWPVHFLLLITNWLPDNVPVLRLRGALVRPFLGSCGKNLRLGRNITFYNPGSIEIGSDVYIAYGCWFMAGAIIHIEDEVMFGPYCVVVSSNHTYKQGSHRDGDTKREQIIIGHGAWIAAHVTITAGSEVGRGASVAANAVVHGKLPNNVLAGGQPAKVIKTYE
jgi:acetyltransferase-like isoleucine patch superfamily enzyme